MLNVTTVGLLVGSLFVGVPSELAPAKAGDCDELNYRLTHVEECEATEISEVEPLVTDAFAFGNPSDASRFKVWVEGAYGQTSDQQWASNGSDTPFVIVDAQGKVTAMRFGVGAEVGVLHSPNWKVSLGGQLNMGSNTFNVETPGALVTEDIEGSLGLQNVKAYAQVKGRVLGVHGGYMFDLGDQTEFEDTGIPNPNVPGLTIHRPTSLGNTDGRDAIFFGADFDYPGKLFRVFAGADYHMIQEGGHDNPNTPWDETQISGDDFLNVVMGFGLRVGILEIGPSVMFQSRLAAPVVPELGPQRGFTGGHAITFAPYLRLSPPSLPVSFSVRGAVREEYTEFGYPLQGANSVKSDLGVTVGLTYGFD